MRCLLMEAVGAVTIACYATCCSDAASPSEASESQVHASWANHSCVTRQSGQWVRLKNTGLDRKATHSRLRSRVPVICEEKIKGR
jgi:hypothetical protein